MGLNSLKERFDPLHKESQPGVWLMTLQIVSPSFHATEMTPKKGNYILTSSTICVKMVLSNQT